MLRLIEAPVIETYADASDDRAFVVSVDLRVEWTRNVAIDTPGPVAQTVGAQAQAA